MEGLKNLGVQRGWGGGGMGIRHDVSNVVKASVDSTAGFSPASSI